MDSRANCYRLLSLLLAYPDDRLQTALPALAAEVAQWPPGGIENGLQDGLAKLAAEPLLRLQEAYTAAFDLDPACTLNLTYHLWRDSEKRSTALARLHQLYLDAGWETTTGELPDYLPLMLEFMAVCPGARAHDLIRSCLGCVEDLAPKVRLRAPLYAALLDLLNEDSRPGTETTAAHEGAAAPAGTRTGDATLHRSSS